MSAFRTHGRGHLNGPVVVVGTGLLGTSIGLGLRGRGVAVFLSDPSPTNQAVAVDIGAGLPLARLDGEAPELVVVAAPPDVTADVVARALADYPEAVVVDIASVKAGIQAELRARGADLGRYVGTHPMAGREKSGPVAARGELFTSMPWVICPTPETRPEALQAAVASADGVVHGAGWLVDAAFWRVSEPDRDAVFAAKIRGTARILEALQDRPEAWFVAYSSLTGAAGGAGQSSYGAANAWLDHAVATRGERSLSVAWGPWQGEGLAAETLERRSAQGMPPMAPDAALEALDEAVRSGARWVAVADLQVGRMAQVLHGLSQPLWSSIVPPAPTWTVGGGPWWEHRVHEQPWVSAADQLVWALRRAPALRDVRWRAPLLAPDGGAEVRWTGTQLESGGVVGLVGQRGETGSLPPGSARGAGEPVDIEALYASFRRRGVHHGRSYRRTTSAWQGEGAVGGVAVGGTTGQRLDALLSLAAVWADGEVALVPASAARVQTAPGWEALTQVQLVRLEGDPLVADVWLADAHGRPCVRIERMRWMEVGTSSPVPAPSPERPTVADAGGGDAAVPDWVRLPDEARHAWLVERVVASCSAVLELEHVVVDRDLGEQGLDSIVALELRDRLRQHGIDVPLHRVVGGASPLAIVAAAEEARPEVPVSAAEAPAPSPAVDPPPRPAEPVADGNDPLQAWWWAPFFLGALVGATLWALLG